ncbi:MAG: isoprenylcysteine carboxylmethyltransferase family protein [Chloroflexi bacterium]|nr:isoprenylcysteine carboxylmethyltransferase family protein [Chloroflexota bacterium]
MNDLSSPLVLFISLALYGVLHSFLASRTAKDWARKQFGESLFNKTYRLFFNLVGIITLLPLLLLVLWLPDWLLYSVPAAWRPFMLAGQGLALVVLAAALSRTDALDFAGLRQLSSRADTRPLVTDGLYRWMRHPLYTGSMLFLWLLPEVSANFFALNLAITFYFVIGAVFEERKLEKVFGEAYRDYKSRTPMFLPWPRPECF